MEAVTIDMEVSGTRISCDIEEKGQGEYDISYLPPAKGRHEVGVKISGKHVMGSPFNVDARPAMETPWLLRRSSIVDLKKPCGIACSSRWWEVIVSEESKHCVSLCGLIMGEYQVIGSYGSGEGQFDSPRGVAVDSEGNILVADSGNHRIQKFTADGTFISAVGALGRGLLQFFCPSGIAYNWTNDMVYVVDANHHVQVLYSHESEFYPHGIFGVHGKTMGQFNCPSGIACDSTGKVYVADGGNYRIQIFTAEMGLLWAFKMLGEGSGEVEFPIGVAVDLSDRVYVSERGRVSVFTPEGDCVKSFGKFSNARGLAVGDNGVLYVCDENEIESIFSRSAMLTTVLCMFVFLRFMY